MGYVNPLPQHKRATPARCRVLANRLRRIISQLEAIGVRVPPAARLRREAHLLEEVARARAFPTGKSERRRVANAIRDVYEFQGIIKLAGIEVAQTLAADLVAAMKGTSDHTDPNRKPYQFQSQLWVGSVFARSPIPATVMKPGDEPTPDFLLDVEGRPYGLEVKRPASEAGISAAMRSARDQLAGQDLRGGVAFDLSDCLPEDLLFLHGDDPDQAPYARMEVEYTRLYHACQAALGDWEAKRHRPGYARICFLIVYVNGWRWTVRGPKAPELFTASHFARFTTAKGNMAYWDGERVRNAYLAGLMNAGFYVTRET